MMNFDSIEDFIKEFNKFLLRRARGLEKGIIGQIVKLDNIPMKPVYSKKYTRVYNESKQVVGLYKKIIGLEPLKKAI